MFVKMIFVFCY